MLLFYYDPYAGLPAYEHAYASTVTVTVTETRTLATTVTETVVVPYYETETVTITTTIATQRFSAGDIALIGVLGTVIAVAVYSLVRGT